MLSPLARALPAMTALQATVALGVFALSVLAPQLGLSVAQLAALNTLMFGVGALGALYAGPLLARFGDWNVAAACAAAVALGMGCLWLAFPFAPWVAVLLFGLAYGPETPASASALTRVTPAARRPWIFSVRQTGNQIGAMAGSLLLPMLLAAGPRWPYAAVGAVAVAMAAWCMALSRGDWLAAAALRTQTAEAAEPAERAQSTQPAPLLQTAPARSGATARSSLRRVAASRGLRALAFAALAYTAVQMCLNTFLMSLAVREWNLGVAQAALAVAWLQAAGLGGRLFWGWIAQRIPGSARVLGGIGLLVALAGITLMMGSAPRLHAGTAAWVLVLLLGFSASGWNGVLVAEVSRIAGAAEAGALTGVVLMFGYAGLTAAPLAFAALAGAVSMAGAFSVLFALAGVAGAVLLLTPPEPAAG